MSLVTRLLGFGLSLLGAFLIGYNQGIQALSNSFSDAYFATVGEPSMGPPIISDTARNVQQNINPWLEAYIVVGIVLAIGGLILVVRGDRKRKSAQEPGPLQEQPIPAKQP